MRLFAWWPPALHLVALAVALPLAVDRFGAVGEGALIPDGTGGAATEAATSDPAPILDLPAADPAELAALTAEIAARPLFQAGRGAVVETPAPEPEPEPEPEAELPYRMVGFIDDGGSRRAVIISPVDGSERTVRPGDEVDGYRVTAIEPDRVVLRAQDGREISVRLFGE